MVDSSMTYFFLEDEVKRIFFLVALAMVIVPSFACASGSGVYLAPKFSFSVQHTRGTLDLHTSTWGPRRVFGAGAGGALALGYDFAPKFDVPVRLELEYGASDHISKTASIKVFRRRFPFRAKIGVQTLLFHAYADIPTSSGFTPYIGAGAGMAFLSTKGSGMGISTESTDSVPVGQVGLGCSYAFNRHVSVDMGYRFVFMGGTDTTCNSIRLELHRNYIHQVMLGLRVMF